MSIGHLQHVGLLAPCEPPQLNASFLELFVAEGWTAQTRRPRTRRPLADRVSSRLCCLASRDHRRCQLGAARTRGAALVSQRCFRIVPPQRVQSTGTPPPLVDPGTSRGLETLQL